jgi:hypothetical protein
MSSEVKVEDVMNLFPGEFRCPGTKDFEISSLYRRVLESIVHEADSIGHFQARDFAIGHFSRLSARKKRKKGPDEGGIDFLIFVSWSGHLCDLVKILQFEVSTRYVTESSFFDIESSFFDDMTAQQRLLIVIGMENVELSIGESRKQDHSENLEVVSVGELQEGDDTEARTRSPIVQSLLPSV